MSIYKLVLSVTYGVFLGFILQMTPVGNVYAENFFTIKNGQLYFMRVAR